MMRRPGAFEARSYPASAFGGLADPVLNVDWFEMTAPTFAAHPHAGFSAVTYLFEDSPNGFRNRDSLGGDVRIEPGAMHWTRASRGILHEEVPLPGGDPVRGLQIFINLPEAAQADAPGVYGVGPQAAHVEHSHGGRLRTMIDGTRMAGDADALPSPVRLAEGVVGTRDVIRVPVPAGWGGLLIALEGGLMIGDRSLEAEQAVAFTSHTDDVLTIRATGDAARFAIVAGARLDQPVHGDGPLKLASAPALAERTAAYHRGEFGTLSPLDQREAS